MKQIPGFPIVGPTTLEDWIMIDGKWHCLVYVFRPDEAMADLYIDGQAATQRAEYAYFDRVLTPEEIETHYKAGKS